MGVGVAGNRRTIYNRASADLDGQPWSERKALSGGTRSRASGSATTSPDFEETKSPHYRPGPDASGVDALSGIDPFIMQSDGKGWLYVPAGLVDGPMPAHYEPQESPFPNALYAPAPQPGS